MFHAPVERPQQIPNANNKKIFVAKRLLAKNIAKITTKGFITIKKEPIFVRTTLTYLSEIFHSKGKKANSNKIPETRIRIYHK